MPTIDELRKSKYLKKTDVEKPCIVTIKDFAAVNMAREGDEEDMKWVLSFLEDIKPLSLNTTNEEIIAAVAGSRDLNDWKGLSIVIYIDPNVMYAGKRIGGIRVRAPKPGYTKQTQVQGSQVNEESSADDDIPF